jgi:TonB family protein
MLSILAAMLMQAATPAVAPPAPPPTRPSVITTPDWLRKPTGEDMARFYPPAAAAANVEGRATLHCSVTAEGALSDCTTAAEDPVAQGFGDAALSLAAMFRMRPMTKDGVPVSGGKINIPIRFMLPKPQAPPTLELALECYGAAAAQLEGDPSVQQAQVQALLWEMAAEVLSMPEHLKPSELAARLAAARKLGGTAASIESCQQMVPPGLLTDMSNRLGNIINRKP